MLFRSLPHEPERPETSGRGSARRPVAGKRPRHGRSRDTERPPSTRRAPTPKGARRRTLVPTNAAPSPEGAACARLPAAPGVLARLAQQVVQQAERSGVAVVLVAETPAGFALAAHVCPVAGAVAVAVTATRSGLVGMGQDATHSETADQQ